MDIIEQIEAGTLSLSELVNTLSKDWDYSSLVWSQRYHELTEVVGKAQSFTGPEHDDLLKRLWYERDNGVASIKQGVPSSAEYHQNIPLLRELTEIIRKNPDAATYQQVTKRMLQAKAEGNFSRMYWSLRNRVFAAFSAEKFTTIVDENAFNNVVGFLNKHYRLELALNGSWLEKNQEFKQAINVRLPHRDPHYVNMAMWHTYEELCEHENNKTPKGQISISGTEKESQRLPLISHHIPQNQIYFGPPGTGKTFILQSKMKEYTTQAEHADLDAWLDSHLESLNWMQVITLVLVDLNKRGKVRDIVEHSWFQRKALLNG